MTTKNGTITCEYGGQQEMTQIDECHSFINDIVCDIIDKVDEITYDVDKNFEFIPCPIIDKSYIKVNDFLDTIEENSVSMETEEDVLQIIDDGEVFDRHASGTDDKNVNCVDSR